MRGNRLTLLKDKNAYNVLLFTHQYTYKSENFTKEAVKKQAEEEKEALKQEMHDCIKVAGKQINFCVCSKRPFPEWHSTERDSS